MMHTSSHTVSALPQEHVANAAEPAGQKKISPPGWRHTVANRRSNGRISHGRVNHNSTATTKHASPAALWPDVCRLPEYQKKQHRECAA